MFESAPTDVRDGAVAIEGYSGLVWVTGNDAVTFLDSLLSQNVAAMEPGTTAQSLLLGPNGKLRATLHILRGDNGVGLVCDSTVVQIVAADLRRFKIRVDVEIEIAEGPVWDVWGGSGPEVVENLHVGNWSETAEIVCARVPFRYGALPRWVIAGERPNIDEVGIGDVEAFRIEIGQARLGVDLDDKTIPQEGVDVAATVDFGKGCYLGQELVARIDSRGHVNRRLCGLVFDADVIPPVGSDVFYGGKLVGSVTSAAWSRTVDAVVALAMIRVEVQDSAAVVVGDGGAKVAELPILA